MNPLADVVGASGLHVFAEIALVLFLIAFGSIVTQLLTARQSTLDHAARLPLEDDVVPPTSLLERES
jgi:cbb3-type cytochrome oxidase subunit 3